MAINPASTSIVFLSPFSASDKTSAATVPPFDFVRITSFRSCTTSGMYKFSKNLEATSNPRGQKDVTKQVSYPGLTNRSQFSCPGDLAARTGDSWFVTCLSSALDGMKGQIFTLQSALSPFPEKCPWPPANGRLDWALYPVWTLWKKSTVSCARCESNRSSSVVQPIVWSLYRQRCSCYPFHEARKREVRGRREFWHGFLT